MSRDDLQAIEGSPEGGEDQEGRGDCSDVRSRHAIGLHQPRPCEYHAEPVDRHDEAAQDQSPMANRLHATRVLGAIGLAHANPGGDA